MTRLLLPPAGFNPRACEGATDMSQVRIINGRVSIHAPVKARQFQKTGILTHRNVSIHAPVKARLTIYLISQKRQCFNPRACEGATPPKFYDTLHELVSIHAPVKARPRTDAEEGVNHKFQSTRL